MASASLTPDQAYSAALARHMAGDLAEAERIYRLILEAAIHPPSSMALGVLYGQTARYPESAVQLRKAADLMPDSADAWSNLGNVLRILEDYQGSVAACLRAVDLQPGHAFAWANLSAGLRMVGRLAESLAAAEKALAIDPGSIEAMVNRGSALQQLLRQDEAIAQFREITRRIPDSMYGWSCLIMAMQYSESCSAQDLAEPAAAFGQLIPSPPRSAVPKRIRRVGFVSGDFCQHPVGQFITPLARRWDHSRHQLSFYSNLAGGDDVTESLRSLGEWREILGLSDPEACRLIEQDQIDLLIDLSGHSAKGRLALMALRPAPLSATYLGGSTTTGLRQVDFVIADHWVGAPESASAFVERAVHLPGSVFCLGREHLSASPPPSGPSLRIGSFNNPAKLGPACLDMWCEVLDRLPEATLVLKYRGFDDKECAAAVRAAFTNRGLASHRLELHGWLTRADHAALLAGLDMGLDTWPYSGATTTADLLAAGIPCPTLVGDRYASRMSASILSAAGLPELIASDRDSYIKLCVELGTNTAWRNDLRDRLGPALAASRLCDEERFAREFQDLIDTLPSLVKSAG